jgi:hypothetical protein
MSSPTPPKIRARQIIDSDLNSLSDLLATGFPRRTARNWRQFLARLAEHPTPAGLPKFGYLLESDGTPVGTLLLISSSICAEANCITRCNLSSWYVDPAYRSHAPLLYSRALKHKDVTYMNVSASSHVLPIVEAFGFSKYSDGQFAAIPALCPVLNGSCSKVVDVDCELDIPFDPSERELLKTHAKYGCISVWCVTSKCAHPFVFLPRIVKRVIPCVQLIYCRDVNDFVRFASPIGRFLALRGRPLVLIDANGPIPGLVGRYFGGVAPKYFKGPDRPRLGDLSYTEAALLGL